MFRSPLHILHYLFSIVVVLDDLLQEDYATEQRWGWATARRVQAQLKQLLMDECLGATLLKDHTKELLIQVSIFPDFTCACLLTTLSCNPHPSPNFFMLSTALLIPGHLQNLHFPEAAGIWC